MITSENVRKVEGLEQFDGIATVGIDKRDAAKVMSMLSESLYSDRILAPVREYICNAIDANVLAGNANTPIVITLPTFNEPTWRVRDFGLGLSPKDVKGIFGRFGRSLKDDTNDMIGAFGIGSKSAFAYTDSYTLTSIHNGVSNVFIFQKSEDGEILIVPVSSDPTTEPSGIEVAIAVSRKDSLAFRQKSFAMAQYMKVRPTFVNAGNDFQPITERQTGNGWALMDRVNPYVRHGQPMAIMGGVAYPVDVGSCGNAGDLYSVLTCATLAFKFNIGDLDITNSRESLRYTQKTIRAILAAAKAFKAEVIASLSTNIDAFPNIVEAFNYASNMIREFSFLGGDVAAFTYKGVKLQNQFKKLHIKEPVVDVVTGDPVMVSVSGKDEPLIRTMDYQPEFRFRKSPWKWVSSHKYPCISDITRFRIVINDVGEDFKFNHRLNSLAGEYNRYGHQTEFFIIDKNSPIFDEIVSSWNLSLLPDGVVHYASKLAHVAPPKRVYASGAVRESRAKIKTFVMTDSLDFMKPSESWTNFEGDLPDGIKLYVAIKNFRIADLSGNKKHTGYIKGLNITRQRIGETSTIYGVRVADVNDLDDSWVEYHEFLEDFVRAKFAALTEDDLRIQATANTCGERLFGYGMYQSIDLGPITAGLSKDHQITKFIDLHESIFNSSVGTLVSNINSVLYFLNAPRVLVNLTNVKPFDLKGEFDAILAKYPFLKIIGNRLDSNGVSAIVATIEMLDRK